MSAWSTGDAAHGHELSPDDTSVVRGAVAMNMHRARLARGMSLRDMSAGTGLSPALLSQIEREVANPTVAALARIARALGMSFAELTRPSVMEPEIVRGDPGNADGPRGRTLFAMTERRRFDISEGVLPPDQPGAATDHGRGSIEHVYVVSGRVTLTVADRSFDLEAGDAVRFSSELPHSYATGAEGARLVTVVVFADE